MTKQADLMEAQDWFVYESIMDTFIYEINENYADPNETIRRWEVAKEMIDTYPSGDASNYENGISDEGNIYYLNQIKQQVAVGEPYIFIKDKMNRDKIVYNSYDQIFDSTNPQRTKKELERAGIL